MFHKHAYTRGKYAHGKNANIDLASAQFSPSYLVVELRNVIFVCYCQLASLSFGYIANKSRLSKYVNVDLSVSPH
jgi:hypothetical protein